MARKLPRCAFCGRAFRPDRYNVHSQIYCTEPCCVRERKRQRQRASYKQRYRDDPEFADRERRRAAEGVRRRRASARDGPGAPPPKVCVPELQTVLTGLVCQLLQSDDPVVVEGVISGYADRGRRLAAGPRRRADPP